MVFKGVISTAWEAIYGDYDFTWFTRKIVGLFEKQS